MLKRIASTLLILAVCCHGALADNPTGVKIHVSMPGNLFYQMDCLTGGPSCSAQAFEKLWQEQGWLDESGNQQLVEFAAIVERYKTSVWLKDASSNKRTELLGPPIPDLGPDPSSYFDLAERIRFAAYQARDTNDLQRQLMLLMSPTDAAKLVALLAAREADFRRWWQDGPSETLEAMKRDLSTAMAEQVDTFLRSTLAFYGIDDATVLDQLSMHLMVRPPASGSSQGRQSETHSVVEVLDGEVAADRLGVVVHELAHYLFGLAPEHWHRLRLEAAMGSGTPLASAMLGLMDEAMATAIGNGALEQALRAPDRYASYEKTPLSFYNDPDIDRAAKLMVAMTADYLKSRRTMDAAFVNRYFSEVSATMSDQLDSLEARLAVTSAAVGDPGLEALFGELRRALGIRSVWTYTDLDELPASVLALHPYLNGVVLGRPGSIAAMLEALDESPIETPAETSACVLPRKAGPGLLYVVTVEPGESSVELEALVRNASPCTVAPFE